MTWKLPPPEVRDRVNAIIGGDIYAEAGARYKRALATLGVTELPSTEAGRSWYRTEGQARYSQHRIGLAVDAQIREAEVRRRAIEALRAEGFTVFTHSRGRIHAQALSPPEFARFREAFVRAGLYPQPLARPGR